MFVITNVFIKEAKKIRGTCYADTDLVCTFFLIPVSQNKIEAVCFHLVETAEGNHATWPYWFLQLSSSTII